MIDERVLVVDRTHHIHARGHRWDDESVVVLKLQIGDGIETGAVRLHFENDPAGSPQLMQSGEEPLLAQGRGICCGGVLRCDRIGRQVETTALDLQLQRLDIFVEPLLLEDAS